MFGRLIKHYYHNIVKTEVKPLDSREQNQLKSGGRKSLPLSYDLLEVMGLPLPLDPGSNTFTHLQQPHRTK